MSTFSECAVTQRVACIQATLDMNAWQSSFIATANLYPTEFSRVCYNAEERHWRDRLLPVRDVDDGIIERSGPTGADPSNLCP